MVCDAQENCIFVYKVKQLDLKDIIHSKLFNDLHSIRKVAGDNWLITSSGNDMVLTAGREFGTIKPLFEILGNDRDSLRLSASPNPNKPRLHTTTEAQLTHLNFAERLSDGFVYASLFHQGSIVRYDPKRNEISEVIGALLRPHSFAEFGSKLFVARVTMEDS